MNKLKTKVVIVGAGPAGLAAALYLKRFNIDFILLEKGAPGGKLNNISSISNFLSYENISGPDLAFKMFSQVSNLNINFINEEVLDIKEGFQIITENYDIDCEYVILANGVSIKNVNIKNYDKFLGHGVSTCAVCDGYLYKDKKIFVYGDSIHIDDEIKYLKSLSNEVIYLKDEKIISFEGDQKLNLIVTDKNKYPSDNCFIFLKENFNFNLEKFNLDFKNNHLLVNQNYETNYKKIYAIGDAIYKNLYQIVGAINDASIATIDIVKKIKNG